MNTIFRVISGWWLVVGLLLAACDFHGPWEYYPEDREVYTGIYTYGYILRYAGNPRPQAADAPYYKVDLYARI